MHATQNKEASSVFKEMFWKQQLEQWKVSKLSQAHYCRKHNLKPHRFSYWKRKLNQPVKKDTFIPVSLIPTPGDKAYSQNSGISLAINNRVQIHLESDFNSKTLLKVIQILERYDI